MSPALPSPHVSESGPSGAGLLCLRAGQRWVRVHLPHTLALPPTPTPTLPPWLFPAAVGQPGGGGGRRKDRPRANFSAALRSSHLERARCLAAARSFRGTMDTPVRRSGGSGHAENRRRGERTLCEAGQGGARTSRCGCLDGRWPGCSLAWGGFASAGIDGQECPSYFMRRRFVGLGRGCAALGSTDGRVDAGDGRRQSLVLRAMRRLAALRLSSPAFCCACIFCGPAIFRVIGFPRLRFLQSAMARRPATSAFGHVFEFPHRVFPVPTFCHDLPLSLINYHSMNSHRLFWHPEGAP
jgi:hypothetical protein